MDDLPQYICKETKFLGYVAFYKGKKYIPFTRFKSGYVFIDEYANTHLYTYKEVDETFELVDESGLDFKIK